MQYFFATGMFRSGTTLLARMLSAHPEVACASDPFAPVFKQFRNHVASDYLDCKLDPNSPLDDYYFDRDKLNIFNALQRASLDTDCSGVNWDAFLPLAVRMAKPFSPLIERYIGDLPANNFIDVFNNAFHIVRHAYGDENTQCVGFKEVWTNEFGVHMLRAFPDMKVVHMVRDPRSVVSSNLASATGAYPIIFLARQWRKLASVYIQQSIASESPERVFFLKYEDLIEKPEETARSLCEFLDIKFHEHIIQPEFFRDGMNQPWIQNSSYAQSKQAFNTNSLTKWQDTLSPERVAMVEGLCFAEMEWLGYSLLSDNPSYQLDSMVFESPEVPESDIAEWLVRYVDQSPVSVYRDLALESLRSRSFAQAVLPDKGTRERFGLWADVYTALYEKLHSAIDI